MPSLLQKLGNAYLRIPFPWRSRILVGVDLQNNRFFERPCPHGGRPRRTVVFADKSKDWVDYAGVLDPQWHQWLRATRPDPPTMQELLADRQRKEQLKLLVARADARWEAKGRLTGPIREAPRDSVLEGNTRHAGDDGLREVGEGKDGKVADVAGRRKLPVRTEELEEGEAVGWGGQAAPRKR